MGGPVEASRVIRLRHLKSGPINGWLQLAHCGGCGHEGPIPVDRLMRRFGDLLPVEHAMMRLRCIECGTLGEVTLKRVRLCDPGCPRQRG